MDVFYENPELLEAARRAGSEYLTRKISPTGFSAIDDVLQGGMETGGYYLFLGSAKNGKSTILRCIGYALAKKGIPVLYCNFEQPGRNVAAKIFSMLHPDQDLRTGLKGPEDVVMKTNYSIETLPRIPFRIAYWTAMSGSRAFNTKVKPMLKEVVDELTAAHPEKRKPLVILENLSDIYNESLDGHSNLTNIVTQTAQEVKEFAMDNDLTILLSHHAGKIQGEEPTLDDVRDSKRVTDLAHSIFVAHFTRQENPMGYIINNYYLSFLGGRDSNDYKKWNVIVDGLDMRLTPATQTLGKKKKIF